MKRRDKGGVKKKANEEELPLTPTISLRSYIEGSSDKGVLRSIPMITVAGEDYSGRSTFSLGRFDGNGIVSSASSPYGYYGSTDDPYRELNTKIESITTAIAVLKKQANDISVIAEGAKASAKEAGELALSAENRSNEPYNVIVLFFTIFALLAFNFGALKGDFTFGQIALILVAINTTILSFVYLLSMILGIIDIAEKRTSLRKIFIGNVIVFVLFFLAAYGSNGAAKLQELYRDFRSTSDLDAAALQNTVPESDNEKEIQKPQPTDVPELDK